MGVVTKTKLALNKPELRVENKISTEKKKIIPKNTMTQHKVMSRYFLVIDAIKYKIIKTFVDFKKKKIKLNIYF